MQLKLIKQFLVELYTSSIYDVCTVQFVSFTFLMFEVVRTSLPIDNYKVMKWGSGTLKTLKGVTGYSEMYGSFARYKMIIFETRREKEREREREKEREKKEGERERETKRTKV